MLQAESFSSLHGHQAAMLTNGKGFLHTLRFMACLVTTARARPCDTITTQQQYSLLSNMQRGKPQSFLRPCYVYSPL